MPEDYGCPSTLACGEALADEEPWVEASRFPAGATLRDPSVERAQQARERDDVLEEEQAQRARHEERPRS